METALWTKIFALYLLVVNVSAFVVFGVDKWKAGRGKWRISEATLLLLAATGGALGSLMAMKTFRHKTKHYKFTILVPFFLIVWLSGIIYFFL